MVYLYLGQEQFLKKHALEKLRLKVCGKDESNLNYEEFYAGEDDSNKIIDCAKTGPFMAKFRFIAVKDVNKFNQEQRKALAAFIENSPSTLIMVLTADSLLPQDPIYRATLNNGRIVNFDLLESEKLYRWIIDRFACFNKKAQPEAIGLLVENIGNNLMRLNNAIESLAMFVGSAAMVKINDVESLTGKDLEGTAFQIVDAIGFKDAKAALKILNSLHKDIKTVLQITGLIGWHLRRIWRVKKLSVWQQHSRQTRRATSLAGIAAIVGVPQYARGDFFNQVKNFSQLELERDFKILLKLDKDLKSKNLQPYRALELLIVRLCASL